MPSAEKDKGVRTLHEGHLVLLSSCTIPLVSYSLLRVLSNMMRLVRFLMANL